MKRTQTSQERPGPSQTWSPEAFYERLWDRPGWDTADANADEIARWEAIRGLLGRLESGRTKETSSMILDLGCGRGWLTSRLSAHGKVLGLDPLQASVVRARELFPHLSFRQGTGAELLDEGWAEHFDVVVASEVIEHVPDVAKPGFLETARELLHPGGHLILTTPRGELWPRWIARASRTQPVEEWIGEKDLTALARRTGFRVVARDRAFDPRSPLTWQGFLLHRVLNRRGLRRLRIPWIRNRLRHRARIYQVLLLRRPSGARP